MPDCIVKEVFDGFSTVSHVSCIPFLQSSSHVCVIVLTLVFQSLSSLCQKGIVAFDAYCILWDYLFIKFLFKFLLRLFGALSVLALWRL